MSHIELREARGDDLRCIENMMQFYMYDFSEWVPLSFAENGLYRIRPKDEYWARPGTQPFLIYIHGELAGFVTVDDELDFPDTEHNIGYFFIGRRFRGKGAGKAVVRDLLNRFSGCWQIYHLDANAAAGRFWKQAVEEWTNGAFSVHRLKLHGDDCTLYKFDSASV